MRSSSRLSLCVCVCVCVCVSWELLIAGSSLYETRYVFKYHAT
jgi:hypothetical protein